VNHDALARRAPPTAELIALSTFEDELGPGLPDAEGAHPTLREGCSCSLLRSKCQPQLATERAADRHLQGPPRARLRIIAGDHRDIHGEDGVAVGQRVAHEHAAESLRVQRALAEGGIDAAMTPLVQRDEAEVGQAICCAPQPVASISSNRASRRRPRQQ